jgi:hypothetical protein
MRLMGSAMRRRFCPVLVKPSHYDGDGYVIQWKRSPIPPNSLATLYGLAKDCAERQVLGTDIDIEIHAFDETNTRLILNLRGHPRKGMPERWSCYRRSSAKGLSYIEHDMAMPKEGGSEAVL